MIAILLSIVVILFVVSNCLFGEGSQMKSVWTNIEIKWLVWTLMKV